MRPKLPGFALIALLICQPCTAQPRSAADASRTSPAAAARHKAATVRSSPRQPQPRYPDPRYRPPVNFAELQAVAGKVAGATGRVIHWQLKLGPNPGPLAKISGEMDHCTISIHPVAARKVPPNTWAFIIGHEFAHRVENLGAHTPTNPANELKADIAGARYAMASGYRLEAFLGWVLTEPNQSSSSHGSLHKRVYAIAAHFRVPQNVIQAEAKRATAYRAGH